MTNRELLERAAKAAGYAIVRHPNSRVLPSLMFMLDKRLWNPLTDDGDALRLAVKLEIGVQSYPIFQYSHAGTETLTTSIIVKEPHNNDTYAATRRAIVRALAEIGKGLK